MSVHDLNDRSCFVAIPGFPEYRINAFGEIESSYYGYWRPVKHWIDRLGYSSVRLKHDGKYHAKRVSRLVLETFVRPAVDDEVSCHDDNNPGNNHVSNLRWDSQRGNMADKLRHGTHQCGTKHAMAILCEEDIPKIFSLANDAVPVNEIAKRFAVKRITIQMILCRRIWKHVPISTARRAPSMDAQQQLIANSGMTNLQLSQRLGVSRAMIAAVMRGERTMRLKWELCLEKLAG